MLALNSNEGWPVDSIVAKAAERVHQLFTAPMRKAPVSRAGERGDADARNLLF